MRTTHEFNKITLLVYFIKVTPEIAEDSVKIRGRHFNTDRVGKCTYDLW